MRPTIGPANRPGSTREWQSVIQSVDTGRSLRVRVTCNAGPGLEGEVRDLVEQLGGAIETIAMSSGNRVGESVCDLAFVPRSVLSAGEIVIALSALGVLVFNMPDRPIVR